MAAWNGVATMADRTSIACGGAMLASAGATVGSSQLAPPWQRLNVGVVSGASSGSAHVHAVGSGQQHVESPINPAAAHVVTDDPSREIAASRGNSQRSTARAA